MECHHLPAPSTHVPPDATPRACDEDSHARVHARAPHSNAQRRLRRPPSHTRVDNARAGCRHGAARHHMPVPATHVPHDATQPRTCDVRTHARGRTNDALHHRITPYATLRPTGVDNAWAGCRLGAARHTCPPPTTDHARVSPLSAASTECARRERAAHRVSSTRRSALSLLTSASDG